MLRHAVRINSLTEFALTKIDVLDTFDRIKVCVGYEVGGDRFDGYPDLLSTWKPSTPIYEELPGWKRELAAVPGTRRAPPAARAFVELIEREVGVPVRYVGVGPRPRRRRPVPGMIPRYSLPEMAAMFDDAGPVRAMARDRTPRHRGVGRARGRPGRRRRARAGPAPLAPTAISPTRVGDREAITDHDVAAFVDVVQDAIGKPAGTWIHYGLTSSDVVDTAWCWMLRDAADLLLEASDALVAETQAAGARAIATPS